MKLYNSASHQKEEFVAKEGKNVSLYTCGPTVYHYAHIGNLRSYLMEDVLLRYLQFEGYQVKRVMNITDVGHLASDGDTGEDKMLAGAKREKKSVLDIARFYTQAFFQDMDKLNMLRPSVVENATDCVPEYIKIITTLLEKGNAYQGGGNIYFDTASLDQYHVFHNHQEEDLEVGVREGVEEDDNKRNKADFVLWFTKSKFDDQELQWDSPWGRGYPGWHLECTAIALKHLGEHLDIHCGGIDNAFPHHTNEIAQSEAFLGHKWCNFWMHVYHLNIQTGKMSKSSGEFLTISLLEEKGYDPLAYRFFCLQSHYRKSLLFTWENLDNAVIAYEKLMDKISKLEDSQEICDVDLIAEKIAQFKEKVGNDLNTSMGITAMYDVLKLKCNSATKLFLLRSFDTVLGLGVDTWAQRQAEKSSTDSNPELETLIAQRTQAKKDKNFALADEIRDKVKEMGFEIVDTAQGATWKKL